MRFAIFAFVSWATVVNAQTRNVWKSEDIDSQLSRLGQPLVIAKGSNYLLALDTAARGASALQTDRDGDRILWIRRGSGTLFMGEQRHELGPGDLVSIGHGISYRFEVSSARLEYVALRIGLGGDPNIQRLYGGPKAMPAVVHRPDANEILHSGENFALLNALQPTSWPAPLTHEDCVEIYFVTGGPGVVDLGTGSRARSNDVDTGDVVIVPRNTSHNLVVHEKQGEKIEYLLFRVISE